METASASSFASTVGRRRIWLGAILLTLGLLGHLVAAYLIRANARAFPDHIGGFLGIALVTGVIIASVGWLFWRGRHDITWIAFCTVQALIGLLVLGFTLKGLR